MCEAVMFSIELNGLMVHSAGKWKVVTRIKLHLKGKHLSKVSLVLLIEGPLYCLFIFSCVCVLYKPVKSLMFTLVLLFVFSFSPSYTCFLLPQPVVMQQSNWINDHCWYRATKTTPSFLMQTSEMTLKSTTSYSMLKRMTWNYAH